MLYNLYYVDYYLIVPVPKFVLIHFFRSNKDNDEMATAAAWLYKATGNTRYLQNARYFYMNGTAWGFNWNDDDVAAAVRVFTCSFI